MNFASTPPHPLTLLFVMIIPLCFCCFLSIAAMLPFRVRVFSCDRPSTVNRKKTGDPRKVELIVFVDVVITDFSMARKVI